MGRLLLFPVRRDNPGWQRYKRQTASLAAQKIKLIAQRQMLDEFYERRQNASDAKSRRCQTTNTNPASAESRTLAVGLIQESQRESA